MDDRLVEFESNFSVLDRYGEDVTANEFITNPAIGRDQQIKELMLILLTPEKSAILIGKPGIGKTAIVEGLAYRMQRGEVPAALQGYTIINIKTASLLGTMPSGESKVQKMIDELKTRDKVILFVDEIHMLIGATDSSSLDFANIFKEGLGRGSIKVIGATTSDEYERYILRDKAFTRRFQKVEVPEPTREETIQIMMGTLPKFEKQTGRKMKYTPFIQERIMSFLVDITSEYKRVFALGSRYPDVCLTLLKQAFSYTVFDNREYMDIFDVRKAIENSKNIYPDVIKKELPRFDKEFNDIIMEEKGVKPVEEWRKDGTPMRYAQESTNSIISNTQNVENGNFANSGFFKSLDSSPQFVDKKELSDMKPVKSIFGGKNINKFATVGSTSVSKGFNEKFNQRKDSKNIDNLLLSTEIGVISKENDVSTNVPIKYSVTDELKPGGTNNLLLGAPISSTLDKKEESYEVEKYKSENAIVKELDSTNRSLMLDGYTIDKPNSSLINNNNNNNNNNSTNRMNGSLDSGNSIISGSKNESNKSSDFDPFGLKAPKKVREEENNSKIVLNNNNSNNFESSSTKKDSTNNNFESVFNKPTSNTITGGLSTKDEYLFGAPMYDNSSSLDNSENSSESSSSVDIFGQLLSNNMRISNGKIVEDLPDFGAGIKTKPIIGDVVSAGENNDFNAVTVNSYDNRNSSDDIFSSNNFVNTNNVSSDDFSGGSSGSKNWKFLQNINEDSNGGVYSNSSQEDRGMFEDNNMDNSSGSFINFSDLNAGRIPQNEVNKFISFSDKNNKSQASIPVDVPDDRKYREENNLYNNSNGYDNQNEKQSRSSVFTDNVLDMVRKNSTQPYRGDNQSGSFYDDMNESGRGDYIRERRYPDNRYDMRRGPYPQDRYPVYDDSGYNDRRYPHPERPRDDRYQDNGYDMRRGPYPQDRYPVYDDNGYNDRRYPYPERPMDDRYQDNGFDMRRGPYPQDRYSMYENNIYNGTPYSEGERPRDDRYQDNGYDMKKDQYPQEMIPMNNDMGFNNDKSFYSERPREDKPLENVSGVSDDKVPQKSILDSIADAKQQIDSSDSLKRRENNSRIPVDLNLETGNNNETYFDDFFED